MKAQDIIASVRADVPGITDADAMRVLEDGEALAALGITDEDQESVEEAHDYLRCQQA